MPTSTDQLRARFAENIAALRYHQQELPTAGRDRLAYIKRDFIARVKDCKRIVNKMLSISL